MVNYLWISAGNFAKLLNGLKPMFKSGYFVPLTSKCACGQACGWMAERKKNRTKLSIVIRSRNKNNVQTDGKNKIGRTRMKPKMNGRLTGQLRLEVITHYWILKFCFQFRTGPIGFFFNLLLVPNMFDVYTKAHWSWFKEWKQPRAKQQPSEQAIDQKKEKTEKEEKKPSRR